MLYTKAENNATSAIMHKTCTHQCYALIVLKFIYVLFIFSYMFLTCMRFENFGELQNLDSNKLANKLSWQSLDSDSWSICTGYDFISAFISLSRRDAHLVTREARKRLDTETGTMKVRIRRKKT